MNYRRRQIVVIGDGVATPEAQAAAETLGKVLAENGYTLVSGGRGGVMEAASKGAVEAGGLVVGIVPGHKLDQANPYCTIVLPTAQGHGRNHTNVLAADAVIIIGGQAGTLSEMSFAWLYAKPMAALVGHGGFADAYAGKPLDKRPRQPIYGAKSTKDLLDWLSSLW